MQSQYYGFTEGEKMQRILLKLSGEALAGEKKQGFDEDTRRFVSQTIVAILKCALLPKRPQIDVPAAGKSLAEQLEAWQSELLR